MQNMSRILNSLSNGVTHLSCPLSPSKTDKIVHDFLRILNTLPNGVRLAQETLINSYSISQKQKFLSEPNKISNFEHPKN